MTRFRIGNDIAISWAVKKNGSDLSLSGKAVKLYVTNAKGREEFTDAITINGNVLSFVYSGLKQKVLGRHTLTIDVRSADGKRELIQDKCGAFTLVGRSCEEHSEKYEISL